MSTKCESWRAYGFVNFFCPQETAETQVPADREPEEDGADFPTGRRRAQELEALATPGGNGPQKEDPSKLLGLVAGLSGSPARLGVAK